MFVCIFIYIYNIYREVGWTAFFFMKALNFFFFVEIHYLFFLHFQDLALVKCTNFLYLLDYESNIAYNMSIMVVSMCFLYSAFLLSSPLWETYISFDIWFTQSIYIFSTQYENGTMQSLGLSNSGAMKVHTGCDGFGSRKRKLDEDVSEF